MNELSLAEISGHIAYTLIFFSFLVRKMLYLRVFAIIASLFSTYYNFKVAGGPIWVPIQWNGVFIAVNLYHIAMIIHKLRPVKLTEEQDRIHQKLFTSMQDIDFRNFFDLGYTRTYNAKNILIEQGEELPALFLILSGDVSILIDGKKVASLEANQFVGEMSFLTREPTRATVQIDHTAKIHFWDRETLDQYLTKHPDMLNKLHAAIGTQLIDQIISKSKQEADIIELPVKKAA